MAYSQIKNAATQNGTKGDIYRTGPSTLYELMSDQSTYDNTNPGITRMLKSTDNGSTWVEAGAGTRPYFPDYSTQGYASDIDANGKIHMVYQYPDPVNTYTYAGWNYTTFNTATDTWGTTQTIYTPTPPVNGNLVIGMQTVAVDKNNVPHIVITYAFAVRNGQSAQTVAVFSRYMNRIGGSWSTSIAVNNPSINQTYADIIIDNNNIPIFSSNEDDGNPDYNTNVYGTVVFYYGDANNPTGFTRQVIATAAGYASPGFPIVMDDLNNIYIGHQARTGYPTFYKHKYGDPYSVWSSFAHSQKGRDLALTVAGRNMYMMWAKTDADGYSNRTISWDMYNGQYWQGMTGLEAAGSAYRLPYSRYSSRNQYAPANIDMTYTYFPQALYYNRVAGTTDVIGYIDASDAAATDPNAAWSSPAEAFNGDFTTGAVQSITSTQSTGFLKAEGTNIPVTSGPITQVRARVYGKGASDGAAAYGGYTTLSVPTGGWTWQKINDLETKINTTAGVSGTPAQIQANIYTDGLAQNLGIATYQTGANGPQAMTVYRVEFAVSYVAFNTYTPSHGTDTLKHTVGEFGHNTDTNRRKTNNTKTHFTSAVKKYQPTRSHTTSSNKKGTNTRTFSTSANKRKAAISTTHQTDTLKRAAILRSHLTDANKKTQNNLVSFTTDALKRALQTKSHSTDTNKRKLNTVSQTTSAVVRKTNTRSHLTDANKRRTGIVKTHTTNAVIRKTQAVVHTTNAYIQPSYGTLSTDYFVVNFIPTIVTATISQSTDANLRRATVQSHSTDAIKRKANAVSQTTDALLRKGITKTHSTDTVKRKTNTKSHTTDALKRASLIKTHTTDAIKRKQFTRSHTTDAFKRALQYKSHTTDTVRRKQNVKTHTTDALKRRAYQASHSTDANKKRAYYLTHSTNAVLRKTNTRTHTVDALKRKTSPISHTTDTLLRAIKTTYHYTDAAKLFARRRNYIVNPSFEYGITPWRKGENETTFGLSTIGDYYGNNSVKFTTTSAYQQFNADDYPIPVIAGQWYTGQVTVTTLAPHTGGSGGTNLNASLYVRWYNASGSQILEQPFNTVSLATVRTGYVLSGARQAPAGAAFMRVQLYQYGTGDAYYDGFMVEDGQVATPYFDGDSINAGWRGTPGLSQSYTLANVYFPTHSTDAIKRKANTLSHSTDSLKRRAVPVTHTTDALKRKVNSLSHTTDTLKRTRNVLTHTTDANKRKANVVQHATDANKRRATTRVHTTDALKRKQFFKTHTTDTLKRKINTKSHTADSFKRTGTELSHNTSAVKRVQFVRSHSTDSLKRKQFTKTHTTSANKRLATIKSHSTSANLRRANLVRVHSTDTLKRAQNIKLHTTDALKRKAFIVSHTTDTNKRRANNIVLHTTDANLRKTLSRVHSTDTNKRKSTLRTHLTDALKRKQNTKFFTTSANKRKGALTKTHSTGALLRKFFTRSHVTSANLRKFFYLSHSTDSNKRRANIQVYHFTDANLRRAYLVVHTTDTIISNSRAIAHTTSASIYSLRGTKMVLVNGTWVHGVAMVLIDGEWHIAQVRYFNGTDWPLTDTQ